MGGMKVLATPVVADIFQLTDATDDAKDTLEVY